jgi:hypothetical protein
MHIKFGSGKKLEEKSSFGIAKHRWQDNVKYVGAIGWGSIKN